MRLMKTVPAGPVIERIGWPTDGGRRERKSDGQAGGEPSRTSSSTTPANRITDYLSRGRRGKQCIYRRQRIADADDRLVCLLLWFLGLMTSYTLGGVLHSACRRGRALSGPHHPGQLTAAPEAAVRFDEE
jgi:hypothetical protein